MRIKKHGTRCVTGLSLAPTGTISLLAEVTSSIEPLFRKAYVRSDRISDRMYIHPIYKEVIEKGTDVEDWFVDTDDIKPEDHFNTQVSVQSAIDGAVSKTINMPAGTTADEFSALTLEYIRDLKGVTVYVDGSREGQILNSVSIKDVKKYLSENNKSNSVLDIEATNCASGTCEL
jgi:ribonucleoside-diphosphate reductase alpha chain